MRDGTHNGRLTLGDLVVDPGARTVHRDGDPIDLPKLSFDLLLALLEAAPDALTIDALMEQVWDGRVVSAATVAKRIELLRQAIGDDAANPRYIQLVRGYGYRLAETPAPVGQTSPGPVKPSSLPTTRRLTPTHIALVTAAALILLAIFFGPFRDRPTPPVAERSLAVLPFQALGEDPGDQWFADGLAEEIRHALGKTGQLQVTGRTSAATFRGAEASAAEIGEALGVAHLLEGTVRRDDVNIRVVARLTGTADGFQLWSETFDAPLGGMFEVQRDIAESVARRIRRDTEQDRPADSAAVSTNPEAYGLFLQAVSLSPYPYGPDYERAQALIERVVELDPGFAPGWNRLAAIHGRRLFFDPTYPVPPTESIQLIRAAVDRALAIDPTLGEAYATLAGLAWAFERDTERAARLLEQAMKLDPGNLQVLSFTRDLARAVGDLPLSRDLGALILRRDPLCLGCRTQYAGTLTCLRDFGQARQELLVIDRGGLGRSVTYALGQIALQTGDLADAANHFERAEHPGERRGGQALLLHARGDTMGARRLLAEWIDEQPESWELQAGVAASIGDGERAVERLHVGMERRFLFVQGVVCAPEFDPIRDDPAWGEFMASLGRNRDGSQAIPFDPLLPPGLDAASFHRGD
ncbi:MAG: winged helix-turn-helix domain-containing protein [Xanthomonadales bacterium]|jgi:TolB-like protein/DNA-binding winged helix-turn-helix (wHTH) protein|nr:winged helix-turn-helix domain-containing protein [Xanthomonadales bacterium]